MQPIKRSNKLWILEASLYLNYLTDHVNSFCRASWSSLPFASGDLVTQILPNQIPNKVCSVSSTRMICLGWFQRGPSDSWKKCSLCHNRHPAMFLRCFEYLAYKTTWFQAALALKMGHAIIAKECQGMPRNSSWHIRHINQLHLWLFRLMQLKLLLPGGIGLQRLAKHTIFKQLKILLKVAQLTHPCRMHVIPCIPSFGNSPFQLLNSCFPWPMTVKWSGVEPCQFQQCGAPHRSAIGRGGRNGRSCWNVQQLGNFDSDAIFMATPTSTLGIGPDGKSKSPLLPGGVWMVSGWCLGRPGKSCKIGI